MEFWTHWESFLYHRIFGLRKCSINSNKKTKNAARNMNYNLHSVLGFTLPGIYPSSFTNIHFSKEDWVLECCKMQVGISTCCKLFNRFMVGSWWGFRRWTLEQFWPFYICRTNKYSQTCLKDHLTILTTHKSTQVTFGSIYTAWNGHLSNATNDHFLAVPNILSTRI